MVIVGREGRTKQAVVEELGKAHVSLGPPASLYPQVSWGTLTTAAGH